MKTSCASWKDYALCSFVSLGAMFSLGGYVLGSDLEWQDYCMSPLAALTLVGLLFLSLRIWRTRERHNRRCSVISFIFSFLYCSALIIGANICNNEMGQIANFKTWAAVIALVPYIMLLSYYVFSLFDQFHCRENSSSKYTPHSANNSPRHKIIDFCKGHSFFQFGY